MNKVKSSLGRGLDALINQKNFDESNPVSKYTDIKSDDGKSDDVLTRIPVNFISPNPFQPRTNFDSEAMDELKKSILSIGLIQPITVRRFENKYELISGERRLKACKDIGFKDIPAYVIKVDSNEAMLAMALIENIQREKLNPIEISMAYKRLMDECFLTQEQIAEKVGKDRTTIANMIRLLKLPEEIKDSIAKEEISSGHARTLINIPDEEMQIEILHKIKKDGLSVRKVEQLVKDYIKHPKTSVKNKISFPVNSKLASANLNDFEDKLRKIFGTKVSCKQKQDGSGEISIEFYSYDELERLFELFEIIDKSYN